MCTCKALSCLSRPFSPTLSSPFMQEIFPSPVHHNTVSWNIRQHPFVILKYYREEWKFHVTMFYRNLTEESLNRHLHSWPCSMLLKTTRVRGPAPQNKFTKSMTLGTLLKRWPASQMFSTAQNGWKQALDVTAAVCCGVTVLSYIKSEFTLHMLSTCFRNKMGLLYGSYIYFLRFLYLGTLNNKKRLSKLNTGLKNF